MDRWNIGVQLKNFFSSNSFLSNIIIINIAIWLILIVLNIFSFLYGKAEGVVQSYVYQLFSLSADLNTVLHRPWTLVTYMFLHANFFHLFFNMFMLYIGGILFSQYLGKRKLIATYFISGLVGGALFIIAWNYFPAFKNVSAHAIGASAAVLGVFIAVATYVPNYKMRLLLIGDVKLKYIALLFIVVDLFSINGGNAGGHIAHLGGALYGFLSVYLSKYAKFRLSSIRKPFKNVSYRDDKQKHSRPISDEEYNNHRAAEQKRLDEILDKISKSGYEKLSKEEKEFLFKSSKK